MVVGAIRQSTILQYAGVADALGAHVEPRPPRVHPSAGNYMTPGLHDTAAVMSAGSSSLWDIPELSGRLLLVTLSQDRAGRDSAQGDGRRGSREEIRWIVP